MRAFGRALVSRTINREALATHAFHHRAAVPVRRWDHRQQRSMTRLESPPETCINCGVSRGAAEWFGWSCGAGGTP